MKLFLVSILLFSLTLTMAAIMDMLTLKMSLPDAFSYLWQSITGKEYALITLLALTLTYLLFKNWHRVSYYLFSGNNNRQ